MIFKKIYQYLSLFFRSNKNSDLDRTVTKDPYLYTFPVIKNDLMIDELKKLVLQNPWCLDTPQIIMKDGVASISVLVLSPEKGALLEKSVKQILEISKKGQ